MLETRSVPSRSLTLALAASALALSYMPATRVRGAPYVPSSYPTRETMGWLTPALRGTWPPPLRSCADARGVLRAPDGLARAVERSPWITWHRLGQLVTAELTNASEAARRGVFQEVSRIVFMAVRAPHVGTTLAYGLWHGAVWFALAPQRDARGWRARIVGELCASDGARPAVFFSVCLHGVGHAALMRNWLAYDGGALDACEVRPARLDVGDGRGARAAALTDAAACAALAPSDAVSPTLADSLPVIARECAQGFYHAVMEHVTGTYAWHFPCAASRFPRECYVWLFASTDYLRVRRRAAWRADPVRACATAPHPHACVYGISAAVFVGFRAALGARAPVGDPAAGEDACLALGPPYALPFSRSLCAVAARLAARVAALARPLLLPPDDTTNEAPAPPTTTAERAAAALAAPGGMRAWCALWNGTFADACAAGIGAHVLVLGAHKFAVPAARIRAACAEWDAPRRRAACVRSILWYRDLTTWQHITESARS